MGEYGPMDDASSPLCSIVTPVGMMGYGFEVDIIDAELAKLALGSVPTAIILDAGSTDSGPAKLALGGMTAPRSSYKRDLEKLIGLVVQYHVPLIFSSAGGDGSDEHVDEMHTILQEIVAEKMDGKRHLNVLSIYSQVPRDTVGERLKLDKIQGCGPCVPPLMAEDINSASRIVAQMGYEPFLDAMLAHPDFDVVIGGRAYDPSPYVAYSVFQAMRSGSRISSPCLDESVLGGFFHMGKIMECGGSCATPKCKATTAMIYHNGVFDVYPLIASSRCTPQSVAAHTLYEKSRPDLLYGPGGCLDLTGSSYLQLPDGRAVRVRGALFKESNPYTVKLEAARVAGYRAIFIGRMVDPILTSQIEDFLESVQTFVAAQHAGVSDKWKLGVHKYGDYSVDINSSRPIVIIGEALADNQDLANSVASAARIACVHGPYAGQKATSGNFAMGVGGPLELATGPCTEFCIYHLMTLETNEQHAKMKSVPEDHSYSIAGAAAGPLFSFTQSFIGQRGDNHPTATGHLLAGSAGGEAAHAERKDNGPSKVTNRLREMAVPLAPEQCRTLGELAGVVRSKNSGPYEITFDVIFNTLQVYEAVKSSNLLNEQLISRLYDVSGKDVIYCGYFDQALAFKATIPRIRGGKMTPSGGFMEDDVHGSQQYIPLATVALPSELLMELGRAGLVPAVQ